jgi:CubicO group peptidase (beta-lactamase class C family)
MFVYMRTSARILHPDAGAVPSVAFLEPAPAWSGSVAQARQAVRAALAEENLPGLSVAVGAGNSMVWAEGFGWSDLDQRQPIGPETRFRIGTASMVLTSAAAGLLLEQGQLKLDDAIHVHVPAFPDTQSPITLRHLMGHTSGLRSGNGDEAPLLGKHCNAVSESIAEFANLTLLSEPGTKFHVSSYGWILMIEAAAKQPLPAFLQQHVFGPLGMQDTLPDSAVEPAVAGRATSYFPRFAADPKYGLHLMRDLDFSCFSGASVFVSTPSDLVRFGLAIQNGKLLKPATVQVLQTPQRLASGEETGYGLGWDLETVDLAGRKVRVAGHDGELLGGMAATLFTVPESGIVVAITSNISFADTFALAGKVAQAFAGQAQGSRGR